jgi:hypothetical protein
MSTVPFDTLKLADRLQAGGFSEEQAKTAASALSEAMAGAELVTKDHLDARLTSLEQRLTIKMGGMFVVAVGVLTALIRLL